MSRSFAVWVFATLFCLYSPVVGAAPIQAGSATYEIYNEFQSVLIPDPSNPFNPGPDPIPLTFISTGYLTSVWQEQVGDTIEYEHTSFVTTGDLPIPFTNVAGAAVVPQLGYYGGHLTGIVQDTSDPGYATGDPSSLTMATSIGDGLFGQLIGGALLYSASSYSFEADVTGLPYPVGTVFENKATQSIDIYMQLGLTPDPMTDLKVAEALPGGIVRITNVVPEPSSLLLTGLAFGTAMVLFRRA